jgi:hypothetical protein
MTEQIRLRTLIGQDPLYKAWFMKPATLTSLCSTPPWRLFVQLEADGRWAKVDLPSYAKAYAQVRLRLPDAYDMAIHCKPQEFKPPVVKIGERRLYWPCPDGHEWCGLCRRPTVFRFFSRHPAMKYPVSSEESRCSICGVRKTFLKRFKTTLQWPLKTASPVQK